MTDVLKVYAPAAEELLLGDTAMMDATLNLPGICRRRMVSKPSWLCARAVWG